MGKTTAMEAAHELTYQQTQDLNDVCLPLFRLGEYSSDEDLCNVIFKNQTFQEWIQCSYKLYLFLDSLDEGLLSIGNLIRILKRELIKELPYERLYFRINCRTAVWPNSLTEKFRELWGGENIGTYQIAPLRRVDIIKALQANQIDSNSFVQEVFDKKAVPLANKPITLQFLIDIYKENGQLPSSQNELYEKGCLQLCKEVNPDRYEAGHKGKISNEQRMIISARIASIMIFCNRSTIWKSPEYGSNPESDIDFSNIRIDKEKVSQDVFTIDDDCIEEVLKITGLFSSQKSINRVGFAHKSYAEFLAAWYLKKHETPLAQIKQLLFSSVDSEWKLIPQLYETATWLASMREDILIEIIKTNPDVLLQSDIPTDDSIKASIVDNLLKLHEQNKIKNYFGNHYKYSKLKNSNLPQQLRVYITDSSKNTNTRNLAVDIAKACQCKDLQRDLLKLSLDQSQDIYLRANAADAIASIGDAETKLALKTLLKQDLIEDESDELKGYILQALWPDYITAEELFNSLTKPKQNNYSGSYKYFINIDLLPKLQPNDLVISLQWLIKQGYRLSEDFFAKIGDSLLLKAWENFDLPNIVENFAKIVYVQSQDYTFFITDNQLEQQLQFGLKNDTEKRHLLIKQLVSFFANLDKIPDLYLSHIVELIAISSDVRWMIEKLRQETDIKSQEVWSQMIDKSFNIYIQDVETIHLLLETSEKNYFLREACKLRLQPIELDSWQAKSWKRNKLQQENEQLVAQEVSSEKIDEKQLITERITPHLEQLERGNILEWYNICEVLKGDHWAQFDLTELPAWQNLEEGTHRRIIDAAKQYIQKQNDVNYDWIGTRYIYSGAIAACKAFLLLSKKDLDFIKNLKVEDWKKWSPIVIAAPSGYHIDDSYLDIIKYSYRNAFEDSTNTLKIIIDQEDRENRENKSYLHLPNFLRLFEHCYDEKLGYFLLSELQNSLLTNDVVEDLLDFLIQRNCNQAKEFAQSLISVPLPSDEDQRNKILMSAKILIRHTDSSTWSFIWPMIQQDTLFGCEVLERAFYIINTQLNLTEIQLADLYLWLIKQYSYDEDSTDIRNSLVTPRKNIANIRDKVLKQLESVGTQEAYNQIKRIIKQRPDITWLPQCLLNAQQNMRRNNWNPLQPREFLNLISVPEPSNSHISNQINELSEEIQDMPKESFDFSNSTINGSIALNTAEGGKVEQTIHTGTKEKKSNHWITILLSILAIIASLFGGLMNPEVRKILKLDEPPKIQKSPISEKKNIPINNKH